MAQRPKPRPKARTRSRRPHFDDKAQSERFIQAARERGIESTEGFDHSVTHVLSYPSSHKREER